MPLIRQTSNQSVNANFVDIVTSSIKNYKNDIQTYINNIIRSNAIAPLPYIDINTNYCSGIYINLTLNNPYYLSEYQKKKYGESFLTFLANYYGTNENYILNSIEKILLVASFHYTKKTYYGSTVHNRFHLKSHIIFNNNPEYKEEIKILSNNNTLYINNVFSGINKYFVDYFNTILNAVNNAIIGFINQQYAQIQRLNSICEEGEIMEGGTKNKKINYKNNSVLELKSICKNKKIKNYSKLNKADLIKLLKKNK